MLLRWDEGEVTEAFTSTGPAQRRSLGGATVKSADRQDALRGRDGRLESSGEEVADDIFESEFILLKDVWNFDNVPFPVTKQVRDTVSFMRIVTPIVQSIVVLKAWFGRFPEHLMGSKRGIHRTYLINVNWFSLIS